MANITCPNDAGHKRFYRYVLAWQEHIVDERGCALEIVDGFISDKEQDAFVTCCECGARFRIE